MPPDEKQPGQDQEERVRNRLIAEGYLQPYGTSDNEIRRSLGYTGKCADFVGYHPSLDRWLVAESKGNDIQGALEQIEITSYALLRSQSDIAGKVDLRVYVNAAQYKRLLEDLRGVGGYKMSNGFIGYRPNISFIYSTIHGIRVRVYQES